MNTENDTGIPKFNNFLFIQLESSTLLIKAYATLDRGGGSKELPTIKVPRKPDASFSQFQDIDRLRHYGQVSVEHTVFP